MKQYRFINPHIIGVRNLPDKKQLSKIKKGTFVKINHKGERFWLEVISIKGDDIIGKVDNILIEKHEFKYKDKIKFKKYHIYSTI